MSHPVAARFRAIVTGPIIGSPGTSDRHQNGYEPYGGVRFQDASRTKRKKDIDDAGTSVPKKIARRIPEDEGGSTRDTIAYKDRGSLLKALQDRFKQGPHVDFHGTYEISDPGSNHKATIKAVAIEIWKATGYRFTVKDHPQFSNGHKTRFWCSQDEAHRSKSSRAARKAQGDLYKPRQSSSGESLAKSRFPCRSRLLISSRDSGTPGRPVVTVRMHHHFTHEPYVDVNLPPEVAQSVYDSYFSMKLAITNGIDETTNLATQQCDKHGLHQNSPQDQEMFTDIHDELPRSISPETHSQSTIFTQDNETPSSSHSPTPSRLSLSSQNADIYQRRMLAHIRNLRSFCDGLEFQLPFNDYRMLEVLEREGARFFDFVGDCLKKEGRWVPTDQDFVPHTSSHPTQSRMRSGVATHADQSALGSRY